MANDVATCVYLGEEGTAGTWLVGFQRRATYLHLQATRDLPPALSPTKHQDDPDAFQLVATRVSAKLEERNFRGAVCLACSEDTIAEVSNATIAALRSKHPVAHPDI